MKGEFQPRPQSKSFNKQARPIPRFANTELAQQSFKNGKQLQKQQSFDKAIEQYLRALMYDPSYFQAYCNMGSCYRAQGKFLESRSMYQKSISIKNDDAISHYNLANVERIIGNYQNSIKHYEFVIKVGENPNQSTGSLFVNSLINLGICYKLTDQFEKAIECYERAKKIEPNDEVIIYNQAMAYMALIQAINIDIFHEVSKEKALKAEPLFKLLLKNNPQHEMAILKLQRISSILDKSNENLNRIVTKLKEMLSNQKSTLKDQINSQLGYTLKLLKQYQQSATHYNESFNKTKPSKTNVVEANVYDTAEGYLNEKISVFSEEEAISMIKQGRISQVVQSLARLQQSNISKHVVELAIELHQSEKEESGIHFKNAVDIYNKYFTVNKVELPFEKVSIQAHKLIGNLLSKQNQYKESIRHFEYISAHLKSNNQRSAVHTSLGSDYEALGDKQKALRQYKLALEQEPENYELIYNVGCCLHEGGNHAQSNAYFQKFLELISKDTKIFLPTKNLYIADCLVTMAGSTPSNSPEEFQRYENAWQAIRQVEQGEEQSQVEFDNQKMMNYYLRWADLLEEKMIGTPDKKSETHIQTKQTLLEVYMCLLQLQGCPDRDAILNNCAILYYQEKLYVNALANLNQVVVPTALSLNSLALTYLHLGEHFMATKSIYAALGHDSDDPIINFNKDIIEWIYGIEKTGKLSSIIENQNDSLIFARWQYAVLLVDSLSKILKNQKDDSSDQEISSLIQKIYQKDNLLMNLDDIEKIKLKFLLSKFEGQKNTTIRGGSNYQSLLTFCTTPSQNIETDLKHLLQKLGNNKQLNDTLVVLLLNLFIFTNKDKENSIRTYLQSRYRPKSKMFALEMDRRATITEDLMAKQYTYSSLSDIVANLCTWECELQSKILVLLHYIEKHYYNSSFRDLLQIEYHFPRHNEFENCSFTSNRIIALIFNTFKVKPNIHIKGTSIATMKNQLLDEIEADFEMQMRNQSFITLNLGDKLTVLTIHANFASREECSKFIKELQRQCSQKKEIDISKSDQEISILISGIITLKCTWIESSPLSEAISSLIKSPIQLHLQSILEIEENIYFIQDANGKEWEMLSKLEAFKANNDRI